MTPYLTDWAVRLSGFHHGLISAQQTHPFTCTHTYTHTEYTFLSVGFPYRPCLYSKVETAFSHLSGQLITAGDTFKRLTWAPLLSISKASGLAPIGFSTVLLSTLSQHTQLPFPHHGPLVTSHGQWCVQLVHHRQQDVVLISNWSPYRWPFSFRVTLKVCKEFKHQIKTIHTKWNIKVYSG